MENPVIVLDSSDDEVSQIESTATKQCTNLNQSKVERIILSPQPVSVFDSLKILNTSSDTEETSPNKSKLNNKIISGEISFISKNNITEVDDSNNAKRKLDASNKNFSKIRRIIPTKISDEVIEHKINEDEDEDFDEKSETKDSADEEESKTANVNEEEKTPINAAFATLIEACRKADSTADMELLINKKLIRYYETVHPDFVNSKSFGKTVLAVTEDINANPGLVYLKVSSILEELNIRRKSGQTVISNEDVTTTGNARRDMQIKRLNHALYVLKKRIAKLDEAEVDLSDEDNSTFLLVERYKKRACEIYEKICDITGESKHAHRLVRKPITFQATSYPEFNKTIQTFVNRTKTFPDMFDVLRCLEHCNKQYEFRLSKDEIKRIAQDAFIKIGRSLQKRRKTDLYETVSYFSGTDPALEDATLQTKLVDNQKYHSRINELIDKYAAEQENSVRDLKHKENNNDNNKTDKEGKNNKENKITNGNKECKQNGSPEVEQDDVDDDDDEEDDDSDEETNSPDIISPSKVITDDEIVISDDEELALM